MPSNDFGRPPTPYSTLHQHSIQSSSGHSVTVDTRMSVPHSDIPRMCSSAATIPYPGEGTQYSPYVVDWTENDPENPYNWSRGRKWVITMQVNQTQRCFSVVFLKCPFVCQLALSTWTVSFGSSSYSGGIQGIMRDLNTSEDITILGISLYVLGFALGSVYFVSATRPL